MPTSSCGPSCFEVTGRADADGPAVGYELGPDGATFSEPVTLTFALPASEWIDGAGILLLAFASDSDDVPLATLRRSADVVSLTAEVDHISWFYVLGQRDAITFWLQPASVRAPTNGSNPVSIDVTDSHFQKDGSPGVSIDEHSAVWSPAPGFVVSPAEADEIKSGTYIIEDARISSASSAVGMSGALMVELQLTYSIPGLLEALMAGSKGSSPPHGSNGANGYGT